MIQKLFFRAEKCQLATTVARVRFAFSPSARNLARKIVLEGAFFFFLVFCGAPDSAGTCQPNTPALSRTPALLGSSLRYERIPAVPRY